MGGTVGIVDGGGVHGRVTSVGGEVKGEKVCLREQRSQRLIGILNAIRRFTERTLDDNDDDDDSTHTHEHDEVGDDEQFHCLLNGRRRRQADGL